MCLADLYTYPAAIRPRIVRDDAATLSSLAPVRVAPSPCVRRGASGATSDKALTLYRLREVLNYNPRTGKFVWRVNRRRAVAGRVAGHLDGKGYRRIRIDRRKYQAHHLAWLYVFHRWPSDQIDHINGDRDDNRIANLREVTNRENCQNLYRHRAGRLCGASYDKNRRNWRACIYYNGRLHHLGRYATEQKAHEAYLRALKQERLR